VGPVIGLHRHRGTERPGTSVAVLFSDLQAAVERRYAVTVRPWYGALLSGPRRRALERRWLRGCDVVIATDGAVLEMREEERLGVPVVLVAVGTMPRGDASARRAFPLLRRCDVVAFSSEADRRIFRLHFDACPARQVLLPFGVDTAAFRPPDPRAREELRRELGVKREEVLFLSVGRITAEKNVQSVLKLFADVVERHPRAKLAVAGPFSDFPFREFRTGPYELRPLFDQLLAASPALRVRTRLLGEVQAPNLPSLYGAADAFINLTRHHDENFGYTQVEAMACGLPVVGTDWGGLKDTIRHGETGFKVPAYVTGRGVQVDASRALQYVGALAASPALRRRMGQAGRAVAEREYSLPVLHRNVLHLVAGALRAPRGRGAPSVASDFGRRFARAFGRRGAPVAPRYSARTYPLYRQLILPYATGEAAVEPPPDGAVFFATPLSYQLRRDGLEVVDVTWPGRVRLSVSERALLRWYGRDGRTLVPVAEGRRAMPGAFDRALSGLVRKGLALASIPDPRVEVP